MAVDAHLAGRSDAADDLFRKADSWPVWNWSVPGWIRPFLHIREANPAGDTFVIPNEKRYLPQQPPPSVKAEVLKRDGYRCRYCGTPVVDASVRKLAHRLYPVAVPWSGDRDLRRYHAAFQCFWLQYDHVVPHSHGGSSTKDNIVISCALCNYGKDKYTLRQLGLIDPRDRPPIEVPWDGLERLKGGASTAPLGDCGSRDGPEQAERRAELIAYVETTDWKGPSVIDQCRRSTLADVERFVRALKNGGPISMYFRWAADDDMGAFQVVRTGPH